MKPVRNTAWLFQDAELGGVGARGAAPGGLALTPARRAALVSGDAAVRQAIVLLLTTLPGERVMRPDYGCPLDRLVFSPNDATTAGLAIHYVREALVRFEPRVEIVSLDAGRSLDDATRLSIQLTYRVRSTKRLEHIGFELRLDGSA